LEYTAQGKKATENKQRDWLEKRRRRSSALKPNLTDTHTHKDIDWRIDQFCLWAARSVCVCIRVTRQLELHERRISHPTPFFFLYNTHTSLFPPTFFFFLPYLLSLFGRRCHQLFVRSSGPLVGLGGLEEKRGGGISFEASTYCI
jgi:hypothetical protein